MKRYLLIILGLCTITAYLYSCQKPEQLYENEDIVACGVTNPLQNINWLNNYYQFLLGEKGLSSAFINLYEHQDDLFFELVIAYKKSCHFEYRNCKGEIVYEYTRSTKTPVSKPGGPQYIPAKPDTFLNDKVLVCTLLRYIK